MCFQLHLVAWQDLTPFLVSTISGARRCAILLGESQVLTKANSVKALILACFSCTKGLGWTRAPLFFYVNIKYHQITWPGQQQVPKDTLGMATWRVLKLNLSVLKRLKAEGFGHPNAAACNTVICRSQGHEHDPPPPPHWLMSIHHMYTLSLIWTWCA